MNYGSKFRNKSSALTKEKMRMWLMDSATIYREFQKDGFPQLCDQGDNICQINDIMMYVRGKHPQLNIF